MVQSISALFSSFSSARVSANSERLLYRAGERFDWPTLSHFQTYCLSFVRGDRPNAAKIEIWGTAVEPVDNNM